MKEGQDNWIDTISNWANDPDSELRILELRVEDISLEAFSKFFDKLNPSQNLCIHLKSNTTPEFDIKNEFEKLKAIIQINPFVFTRVVMHHECCERSHGMKGPAPMVPTSEGLIRARVNPFGAEVHPYFLKKSDVNH